MNIITETKMVEEKITKFVAIDGTVFDSEDKCKEWEGKLECTINAAWNNIPKSDISFEELFPSGCSDDYFVMVVPRDMDDIKIINMYCYLSGDECLTQRDIGKSILFTHYDSDYYRYKGSYKTIIEDITKGFDTLSDNIEVYAKYDVEMYLDGIKLCTYTTYNYSETIEGYLNKWRLRSSLSTKGDNSGKVRIKVYKNDELFEDNNYIVTYDTKTYQLIFKEI